MWHHLAQGERKLKPQFSRLSALHRHFHPFHTRLSFTPYHFCSGQGGLETCLTNVISAVGPQNTTISHHAGSELSYPMFQHLLMHLNLCTTETHGEPLQQAESRRLDWDATWWGDSPWDSVERKFKCISECRDTQWCRVSWLTSCVMGYYGGLWSYCGFHIGHASFEPALPRTKMVRGGRGWELWNQLSLSLRQVMPH